MSFLKNTVILFAILQSSSGLELQCQDTPPLCIGDTVISTCSIQSPVVLWLIKTGTVAGNFEIDFNARNSIGDVETDGVFSANLTKHYTEPNTVSESILRFTFTKELNGTTVECPNLLNESLSRSCVIGNNGSIPGNVNMSTNQESCVEFLVSWSEPDTGSTVDYYLISLEPPTNQCGIEGCNISTTHIQLTQLENGINYNISVSACNCFTCGLATVQNFTTNFTKTELMRHLTISSLKYMVNKVDGTGYEVFLYWEKPDCVISYLVNLTFKDANMDGKLHDTIENNFSPPTPLTRGSEFNVSVAGVNGNVTGLYSAKLCVYLEVPGNVTVTMKNITRASSGYLLEIHWEPPRNMACTQPSVDQYIINTNLQSHPRSNTTFLMNLPATIDTSTSLNVSIIAVNVIGMGISTTVAVPFPNGAITQTQPAIIFILVFAIIGAINNKL